MTHGFKNGRLIAEQGTIERVGVGEFLKFDDGTDNFQTFSSNGSPEGVIAADKGSIAHDITGTCLYFKTTDTVNTGWECLAATGGIAGAGITWLATATAASDAFVEFKEFIDSTYHAYMFIYDQIKPATNNVTFTLRTSTDGGVSYDSGVSDYGYYLTGVIDSAHNAINIAETISNTTGYVSGYLFMYNPSAATQTCFNGLGIEGGATTQMLINGGHRLAAEDVDAVQFLMSSGNITSGTIRMYGFVTPS